jgi:signal transduction histidine kinase
MNRLANRLFVMGMMLILLTGVIVAIVGSTLARQAILEAAEARILSIVEQREAHLSDWLTLYIHTAKSLLESDGIADEPVGLRDQRIKSIPGLVSAGYLSPEGNLYRTVSFDGDNAFQDPPDSLAVRVAMLSRDVAFGTVRLSSNDQAVFDIVIPLENRQQAMAVLRVSSSDVLNPILADTSGLGRSIELFLLDRDMRMLTPSRFHGHPAPLKHRMMIPPASAALEQPKGSMEYTSFLGDPVVGGYVTLPRQRWILVGEMSVQGALEPINGIYIRASAVIAAVLLVLLVLTRYLARSWSRPVEGLTRASEKVAAGDYSISLPESSSVDEVGRLTHSFNRMVCALQVGREELETAQREIVKQEKMAEVGKLVTSVVHEMRNPLSSIKMNLRLLERVKCDDPVEKEHLELATGDVQRLEAMLQELLVYGKPIKTDVWSLNPIPILRTAVEEQSPYAMERSVSLDMTAPRDDHPTVFADVELLRRSLDNLIRNAIEACEEGDGIKVSFELMDDEALILVVDNGGGMKENVLQKLFDPFFTTREDGTGLGMSNVRKFVEAMDGSIEVNSEEGLGTTVTIRLGRAD